MTNLFENYHKMPDGTIKQINPFTGTSTILTAAAPTAARPLDQLWPLNQRTGR